LTQSGHWHANDSNMTEAQKIPWNRLAVEAAAIVASILLAFAIDAWWDERANRQDEQDAIRRLIVEYEQNLEELRREKEAHVVVLEAISKLLPMFSPNPTDLPDPVELGKLLIATLDNPKVDPRLGATESLIAAGQLNLIRDQELQAMLTQWRAVAQKVMDWQIIERSHGEDVILPLSYDYIAWPDVMASLGFPGQASAFESDYVGFLSNKRLEGLYDNRRWNHRQSIEQIEAVEKVTLELLEKLKAQLDN
jgi:hypothetical protein